VQQKRAYPESDAMRALLRDIERNGDAAKLWLSENCVFQKDGFIPSRAMYQNFRWWCEENGLHPFSHPKLRDMVLSLHESVHCIRQRAVDPADGTRKLLWGMAGIRLRTSADDQHEHP
jgi:phage/plasmid-associated DNA primase